VSGEAKANLFTRSLKYKLQEARTFWWTSNSLPSTIIFRSVNSFVLRCWFNSFNISVEQEKETDNARRHFRILSLSYIHYHQGNKKEEIGKQQRTTIVVRIINAVLGIINVHKYRF
jgi:hypothetical protein